MSLVQLRLSQTGILIELGRVTVYDWVTIDWAALPLGTTRSPLNWAGLQLTSKGLPLSCTELFLSLAGLPNSAKHKRIWMPWLRHG